MAEYEVQEENSGNGKFQECMQFFYNSRTKEVMGRSAKSWALIGVFYLIFYSILAGFFVGMLSIFLNTVIVSERPKLTGMQSLLKMKPGISFYPLPDYKSTLVKFNPKDRLTWASYVADINARLNPISYTSRKASARFASCNLETDTKTPNDDPMKVCKFEKDLLGDCKNESDYGYSSGKPCIFIKLNKIYGWIPDVKDTSSPYVSCEGETVADKENLGKLQYFPAMNVSSEGGKIFAKISNVFFPYLKQDGYVSPVAAIQFLDPTVNVLTMVRCTLLGLKKEDSLSVRMELLVENS